MDTNPTTEAIEASVDADEPAQAGVLEKRISFLKSVQDCLAAGLIGYLVGVNDIPWFTLI